MITKTELLEEKLKNGEILIGCQCNIPNWQLVEIISSLNYDTIWIDTEHNGINLETLNLMLYVIEKSKATSIVRVVNNDPSTVKPILDMGANGIIFPNVKSSEEARKCVAACTYPLDGIRGYAPGRGALRYGQISADEYIQHDSKKIWKIIQIEDANVLDEIDEIAQIPGIDMIFIGPSDMSGTLGHLHHTDDDICKDYYDKFMEKLAKYDIPVGVACKQHQIEDWVRRGVKWINCGGDMSFATQGATTNYDDVSELINYAKEKYQKK